MSTIHSVRTNAREFLKQNPDLQKQLLKVLETNYKQSLDGWFEIKRIANRNPVYYFADHSTITGINHFGLWTEKFDDLFIDQYYQQLQIINQDYLPIHYDVQQQSLTLIISSNEQPLIITISLKQPLINLKTNHLEQLAQLLKAINDLVSVSTKSEAIQLFDPNLQMEALQTLSCHFSFDSKKPILIGQKLTLSQVNDGVIDHQNLIEIKFNPTGKILKIIQNVNQNLQLTKKGQSYERR